MITLTDKALDVVRGYMDKGEGEFTPGVNGRILCCGFGVGLSIGTMLLEYRNSES